MLLDPGTVPKKWQMLVSSSPLLREKYRVCKKTNLFKPPRSHYDSITDVSVYVCVRVYVLQCACERVNPHVSVRENELV